VASRDARFLERATSKNSATPPDALLIQPAHPRATSATTPNTCCPKKWRRTTTRHPGRHSTCPHIVV
jgi:hypothetical protein